MENVHKIPTTENGDLLLNLGGKREIEAIRSYFSSYRYLFYKFHQMRTTFPEIKSKFTLIAIVLVIH